MVFQLLYIFISAHILLTVISASMEWNPQIHWTALPNGTAYIFIEPLFPGAAKYNVYMKHAILCYGSVSEFEKHDNSIVFVVNKLTAQLSYDIWVMPLDKHDDDLLDAYRFRKNVTISPPVPPELATETEATATPGTTDRPIDSYVTIAVVATLLSVLVLSVIITVVAFKKGYIQKVLRRFPWVCCYRHQTVDILLLYIHKENSPFTSLVEAHSHHLNNYVSCNFVDTKHIRKNPNPRDWLASQTRLCHVLVYVSPLMRQYLLNDEPFSNNSYHTTVVETVENLTSPSMHKGRTRAAFILPGCFDGDAKAARKLTHKFKLPCHLVVQQKKRGPDREVVLNSSCELLHQILGTRMCPFLTCFACVNSTATTDALLDAVQKLQVSSQASNGPASGSTKPHWGETSTALPRNDSLVWANQQTGELLERLPTPDGEVQFVQSKLTHPYMFGSVLSSSLDSACVGIRVDEPYEVNFQIEDDVDNENVSFIQPADFLSSAGSQLSMQNIEENLVRFNKKNDW